MISITSSFYDGPGEDAPAGDAAPGVTKLTAQGGAVRNLDELLARAGVDTKRYRIRPGSGKIGTWESRRKNSRKDLTFDNGVATGTLHDDGGFTAETNFKVQAVIEPRPADDIESLTEAVMERFMARAQRYAPPALTHARAVKPGVRYLLELSLQDIHYGKYANPLEVGHGYSLAIASRNWRQASLQLLAKAEPYNLDAVHIVLGSDALHVNSGKNQTIGGTPQEMQGRYHEAFDCALDNYIWLVAESLGRAARVVVTLVPGNHGGEHELFLAKSLKAWYRNTPEVTIDDSPRLRKVFEFGDVLLMHTHGHGVKLKDLPMLLASEYREAWGRTRFREIHTGHLHGRKKVGAVGDYSEQYGVTTRVAAAMCGSDAWHYEKGYVCNIPGAEAYLWGDRTGLEATFNANVSLAETGDEDPDPGGATNIIRLEAA